MVPIARRNLFAEKGRFVVSVGGVALAILLILIVLALYRGFSRSGQTITELPGQVWVVQQGTIDPFHSVSVIQTSQLSPLATLPGVALVTPVLARKMSFESPNGQQSVYLMALDVSADLPIDAQVRLAFLPAAGEVSIDQVLARKAGLGKGDIVKFGRQSVRVGAVRPGGESFAQFAFLSPADARAAFGVAGIVTYAVLSLEPGAVPEEVALAVAPAMPGLVGFTSKQFAESVRKEIDDTFLPIIAILMTVGFVVGAAVVGLTIYTATIEHWREFGVLKAMGASGGYLYRIVFTQSALLTAAGFALGTIGAIGAAQLATRAVPDFGTDFRWQDIGAVFGATIGMALVASFIPVRRIIGIEPAEVFRG